MLRDPARLADQGREGVVGNLRDSLSRDLAKWQGQLAGGELGATHVGGIAGKAAARFEEYFREVVTGYCSRCSIDYDAEVAPRLGKKATDLSKLTLGELIDCSNFLNQKLTYSLRSQAQAAKQRLASRRLLSPQDIKLLGMINEMRVKLVHRRQEYDERLGENTRDLVVWISEAMRVPFFELAGVEGA